MKKLLLMLVIIVVFVAGCTKILQPQEISEKEFAVNFQWNGSSQGIWFDPTEATFKSLYTLSINSARNDLFYKIYDKQTGKELQSRLPTIFNGPYILALKTLDEEKELDTCVVSRESFLNDFNQYTDGVICKSIKLPKRVISLKIEPEMVVFTLPIPRTSQETITFTKEVTVTNTGDSTVFGCLYIPEYPDRTNGLYFYYKQSDPCKELKPYESFNQDVTVRVSGILSQDGKYIYPQGEYETSGNLYIPFGVCCGPKTAPYNKQLTVKTLIINTSA